MPTPRLSLPRALSSKTHSDSVDRPQPVVQLPNTIKGQKKVTARRKSFSCCSRSHNDVIHGNTRVMNRVDITSTRKIDYVEALSQAETGLFSPYHTTVAAAVVNLRNLSDCCDCSKALPQTPDFVLADSISQTTCNRCGEIFAKPQALDQHYAIHHTVSELKSGDSARNIVEIIFKTSWLKKSPYVNIQRVLKVHNPPKTIAKFEEYRDAVKARANKFSKKNARCVADGNELLRFYSTIVCCALGTSTHESSPPMCCSLPSCKLCQIVRFGFQTNEQLGIYTTASSEKAHDSAVASSSDQPTGTFGDMEKRAMLICRVIAGRVKKLFQEDSPDGSSSINGFDSVAGEAGPHESNVEDLLVFNPNAVLPCFIVVYS